MFSCKKIFLGLSILVLSYPAFAGSSAFVLKGTLFNGHACFLYVDDFGYDENLPGNNKFYAWVRTDISGKASIRLIAPRPGQMVSVGPNGEPDSRLSVLVKGHASENRLNHAGRYTVDLYPHGKRPITCSRLRLQQNP